MAPVTLAVCLQPGHRDLKLLVVVNPAGGKGAAPSIFDSVKHVFEQAGCTFVLRQTARAGEAYEIAAELELSDWYAHTSLCIFMGDRQRHLRVSWPPPNCLPGAALYALVAMGWSRRS
eukprot:scaffold593_cov382-Prasinococcus_capsulatus_cf.AAC.18